MIKKGVFALSCMIIQLFTFCPESTGRGLSAGKQDPDERSYYDVKFYRLDLQVSDSSIHVAGSVTILLDPTVQSLQQVVLDLSNTLTTDSVILNGQKLSYEHAGNKLNIALSSSYDPGELIAVRVFYHGLGKNTDSYSGIYNKHNSAWDKNITWTLSEPFHAMNWFPCKQVLTDKADSVYVFLSTDSNLKAGSVGVLAAQIPLPGNRMRYEWKSRHPIDYYLISFAVGDYLDYSFYVKNENESDSILIQNYIYNNPEYYELNKAAINQTADMIRLYKDLMGEYPFRAWFPRYP